MTSCSLYLHPWCVGDGNQELLFWNDIPLEQQPGEPAVWPCLSFPSPCPPVWLCPRLSGDGCEDTRWQQRAASAERSRALSPPGVPMATHPPPSLATDPAPGRAVPGGQ